MSFNKKSSALAALILLFVVLFLVLESRQQPKNAETLLDAATSTEFRYEIVATETARAQGLSGRADIPHDYGMLFVFDAPAKVGFWMKDMLTPIDIIWLREDGTIIGIEDSVSPDTYPKAYYAPEPVRYVLETRAGESTLKGWVVGTKLDLPGSQK